MMELTMRRCGHMEVTRISGDNENRRRQRQFYAKVYCSHCHGTTANRSICIVHSCGHVQMHRQPFRDAKQDPLEQVKAWRAELSGRVCYCCFTEMQDERFYSILHQHGAILPPLVGSIREIEWARKIQRDIFLEYFSEGNSVEIILNMHSLVKSARTWIKLNRKWIKQELEEAFFFERYGTFPRLLIKSKREKA